MAIKRVREASPLWVWFTIALLAIGATTYAASVALMEYFLAAAN